MGTKKRLLMIDDDPDFVEVVAKILVDAGYEVDAKYNPDDGFKALKTGGYDLLLLDVLMGRGAEGGESKNRGQRLCDRGRGRCAGAIQHLSGLRPVDARASGRGARCAGVLVDRGNGGGIE